MHYYCTCSNNDMLTRNGKTPYREVSANSEDICEKCGHYAVACPIEISNMRALYDFLFSIRKEESLDKMSVQYYRRNINESI